MGKSQQRPAPPPVAPAQDTTASIEPYMQMMAMMMQQNMAAMSSAAQPPELPPMPKPNTNAVNPIDWSDKLDILARKADVAYREDQKKAHGRADTVHTSPLLDETEADVTGSILAGGSKE